MLEEEPCSLKAQQLFKGRVLVDFTSPSSIQSPAVPRDVGLERDSAKVTTGLLTFPFLLLVFRRQRPVGSEM